MLFVVQGEGRGHLTQALALEQILQRAGHELVRVIVVTNPARTVPDFFTEKLDAPITTVEGPGFVSDEDSKAVRPVASLLAGLRKSPRLLEKAEYLYRQIEACSPDLIFNFYDILTGVMSRRFRPDPPVLAIGHQYLFLHPDFTYPAGRYLDRWMFELYTRATAMGSDLRLALSLYPLASEPGDTLQVVPPLLRSELFEQPLDRSDDSLLVYLLNPWFADEVIDWHERHPDVRIHCFWDREDAAVEEAYDEMLTFYRLDDERFLRLMAKSSGLATTAGFESVCEAMYLGKPVYMVPVGGHFEQYCNAYDACRAEAGIRGSSFDLSALLRYREMHESSPEPFRAWVESAPSMVLQQIECLIARRT